ncbi:MAG: type III PLP-dependent enzyme [Alphaproteobacteria bacterium]|nr:type III PLP-dependent enzyme [Alphaproteobacteria bacterium]
MEPEQEYDRRSSSNVYYLRKTDKKNLDLPIKNKTDFNNFSEEDKAKKGLVLVEEFIKQNLPSIPVYCIRPKILKKAVGFFVKNFRCNKYQTDILYSVKSNPDKSVLKHLFDSGIKHFDVASLSEIKLINELFGDKVKMYFMHPIKAPEAIKEAYFNYNIKDFSLDSFDELEKILLITKNAKDLGLHIRLSIPNSHSAIDLSGKFGILPSESAPLLRKTRSHSSRLGVCFHVGSQCMDPVEYRNAIMIAKETIENAGVKLDIIDVGGGFPSTYPAMTPPNLQSYFDEIFESINQLNLAKGARIWCEPGRALVAESGSLVVRVEGRKNHMLYINDGTYGGLFDAGYPGFIYHTKAIRAKKGSSLSSNKIAFGFYGPTCDSLDTMKGPFYLPDDIGVGDYIEIAQLGAYSRSIRTEFNGFNQNLQIEVCDEPIESMYNVQKNQQNFNKSQTK